MGTAIKVSLAALALGGVAWASADWSSAKSKAEDFDRKVEELRKRAPEETRKIVTAVCAAKQDERKRAAESASSDARSNSGFARMKSIAARRTTTRNHARSSGRGSCAHNRLITA